MNEENEEYTVPVPVITDARFDNRIATVNVIEEDKESIFEIVSFPDDEEGNRNAEIHFFDKVRDVDPDLLDEEIEQAIENGIYTFNDGRNCITITHSS